MVRCLSCVVCFFFLACYLTFVDNRLSCVTCCLLMVVRDVALVGSRSPFFFFFFFSGSLCVVHCVSFVCCLVVVDGC